MSRGTSIDPRAEDGSTALIIASNTGHTDVVKHLLTLGANPNTKTNNGWTALHAAADDGYKEIVEVLLQSGADTSLTYRNMDAATWAERSGKTDVANLIRQRAKAFRKGISKIKVTRDLVSTGSSVRTWQ